MTQPTVRSLPELIEFNRNSASRAMPERTSRALLKVRDKLLTRTLHSTYGSSRPLGESRIHHVRSHGCSSDGMGPTPCGA